MCLHKKRPYKKPTITVIPVDSQRYNELMQTLPKQENAGDSFQTNNSNEKEEENHV